MFQLVLWPFPLLLGVLTVSCSISINGFESTAPGTLLYVATHLYAFEDETVQLEGDAGTGGAIEIFGEDLLVVAPHGRIALVHRNGNAEFLDGRVPMNLAAIESHPGTEDPGWSLHRFRVADILLKKLKEGHYELFATHHYFTGECIRFRLSSTTIVEDETNITVRPEWRTIFEFEPCFPFSYFSGTRAGGKMLTDGPDHLLLTAGVHKLYQHPAFPDAKYLGKVLRLEIQTGEVEVLAEGLRNSQGLVRDADGNLWATDHGPQGGDELNLLQAGGNYGWPHVTYGIHYNNRVPEEMEYNDVGRHDGFLRPAYAWIPSPAISAIAVNDEQQLPLWKDDLLVTSLKDRSLFRIRRHGTDVQYFERIELGYEIRDIAIMPDGRIALFNDEEMRIHFLSRSLRFCDEESRERRHVYSADCDSVSASPETDSQDSPDARTGDASDNADLGADLGADPAGGAQLYGLHCSDCHSLNAEQSSSGPHLVGVIGREAGEIGGWRFSAAFNALDIVWTPDNMSQFLTDPDQFAPGTSMPSSSLTEAEARAIADYLDGSNH